MAQDELANLLDALCPPDGPEDEDTHPDPRVSLLLLQAVLDSDPAAAELVREHAEQFGEVLPTVLMADLARWYVAYADPAAVERSAADRVAAAVGRLFGRGEPTLRAVIANGFLEHLPRRGEPEREVVQRLPRRLRRELAALQDPVPTHRRWRRRTHPHRP